MPRPSKSTCALAASDNGIVVQPGAMMPGCLTSSTIASMARRKEVQMSVQLALSQALNRSVSSVSWSTQKS